MEELWGSLHFIGNDVFKVSQCLASSLSLVFAFIALIFLCSASVKADNAASKKAEYEQSSVLASCHLLYYFR